MRLDPKETNKRTLNKALTNRLYKSFMIAPIAVFALTEAILLTFKFSILEFVVMIPASYLFREALVSHSPRL